MIRWTMKLDDETIAGIERVVEHFKHLDPERVREIMTEVEQHKTEYWRDLRASMKFEADMSEIERHYRNFWGIRPIILGSGWVTIE